MRIFVLPSKNGASRNNIVLEAHDILQKMKISSARPGGFINGGGVVLVDMVDVPAALKALKKAGLRADAD